MLPERNKGKSKQNGKQSHFPLTHDLNVSLAFSHRVHRVARIAEEEGIYHKLPPLITPKLPSFILLLHIFDDQQVLPSQTAHFPAQISLAFPLVVNLSAVLVPPDFGLGEGVHHAEELQTNALLLLNVRLLSDDLGRV